MNYTKKTKELPVSNNAIGEKIDVKKASCREWDLQEHYKYIKQAAPSGGFPYSWSWGFNSPVIVVKNKALRFTVQGHFHKGHVYIVLDFMDTFTIYYTSNQGNIKKISKDIYIDQLIEVLDNEIERIPKYVR